MWHLRRVFTVQYSSTSLLYGIVRKLLPPCTRFNIAVLSKNPLFSWGMWAWLEFFSLVLLKTFTAMNSRNTFFPSVEEVLWGCHRGDSIFPACKSAKLLAEQTRNDLQPVQTCPYNKHDNFWILWLWNVGNGLVGSLIFTTWAPFLLLYNLSQKMVEKISGKFSAKSAGLRYSFLAEAWKIEQVIIWTSWPYLWLTACHNSTLQRLGGEDEGECNFHSRYY